MFMLLYPGKQMPEWLNTVTPKKGEEDEFKKGSLEFGAYGFLYKYNGYCHCYNLFGDAAIVIKNMSSSGS